MLAEHDTLLHLLLVVRLSTLGLNILLDTIDGRFILDQTFLDLIQSIVDLVLEDHVAASVVLHRVISRLLGDSSPVGTHLLANRLQALLLGLVGSLELIDSGELVRHFILHSVDVLAIDFHLLIHATFKICDLLQVTLSGLNFDLQRGSSTFSLVELSLLEVKIFPHLFNLIDAWQSCLAVQVLVHVLKQGRDSLLRVRHLRHHLLLIILVLLRELIDLLLLVVENLKLFLATHATTGALSPILQLVFDIFDIAIVGVDHFSQIANLLILLLDLGIVLLDAIHEALASLREGQIVFIALQLQVIFSLLKLRFLLAKMLRPLLKRVLFQAIFGGLQPCSNIFQLLTLDTNLIGQAIVFVLKLFIFVPLLRVQVVKSCLISKVDIIDLLLV